MPTQQRKEKKNRSQLGEVNPSANETGSDGYSHYRQMFEKSPAIQLLIAPEDGAILDANQAASEFYGYGIEQLKKLNISNINTLPPDKIAEEMARAVAEQRNYFNFRHTLASGEVRDVEVHS